MTCAGGLWSKNLRSMYARTQAFIAAEQQHYYCYAYEGPLSLSPSLFLSRCLCRSLSGCVSLSVSVPLSVVVPLGHSVSSTLSLDTIQQEENLGSGGK